jgi:hypothetical protein
MKRSGTSGTVSSSSRKSIALREEAAARASRNCPEETVQYQRVVTEKAEVRTDVGLQMELRNRADSAAAGLTNDESSGQPMDISVITSLMNEYEREHERLKELIMNPVAARRPRRTVERRLGVCRTNLALICHTQSWDKRLQKYKNARCVTKHPSWTECPHVVKGTSILPLIRKDDFGCPPDVPCKKNSHNKGLLTHLYVLSQEQTLPYPYSPSQNKSCSWWWLSLHFSLWSPC